jgi:integrase
MLNPLLSKQQAEAMVSKVRQKYAKATSSRLVKFFKQFWVIAVKNGMANINPFEEMKAGSSTNQERIHYVPRETIESILSQCQDLEWQVIISLARYGGIRVPSELRCIKWSHVDWVKERIAIHSSKTGIREIPLFDEIKRYLKPYFEQVGDRYTHLMPEWKQSKSNFRTRFTKMIKRAGFKVWPRIFHNLRASCGMDLISRCPIHVYQQLMGHTPTVALQHYMKVRDSDFESVLQNAVQQKTATHSTGQNLPQNNNGFCKNDGQLNTDQYTRRDSNPQPSVPKTDALSS